MAVGSEAASDTAAAVMARDDFMVIRKQLLLR